MKTYTKNLFLLPALISAFGLIPAGRVPAQTFTTLHSFNGFDGAYPEAGFILSGNTLYGTASNGGGAGGPGTVFAIQPDGASFTNLHALTASDGAEPYAGLVLAGDTLYGTTSGIGNYGTNGNGTVFAIKTNGTGYTNLYSFTALDPTYYTNRDGQSPRGSLVLSGNTLYGTASAGGASGKGTLFAVNTNGSGFTNLHSFKGPSGSTTNNDGGWPNAGLVLAGNALYGTTAFGSGFDNGTVFKINTDGTGYTNLHNFAPLLYNGVINVFTNADGANPFAGLILSGDTLYGTANNGGNAGSGTVFALNTNGTIFTTLHSFTSIPSFSPFINSDGSQPYASLILSGGTLYGTAAYGGASANGTVFAVRTNGTGFTNLHSFTALDQTYYTNSDGANPFAELTLSGNILFGTAKQGGASGAGTVFSLSLPLPQLTIVRSGTDVVLTWPADVIEFALQSTTNLTIPEDWAPVPQPAVTNGGAQISVTIPASTSPKFFRLKSH
jgi:uncharacterized repeat protein (TIGR03803 family)